MSVSDKNKIDAISINPSDEVILSIADHLDWENINDHINELQDKLNIYIQFVESGQIFDDYPKSINRKIVIEVVSKYPFANDGLKYIERVKPILYSIGIEIRQRVLEML